MNALVASGQEHSQHNLHQQPSHQPNALNGYYDANQSQTHSNHPYFNNNNNNNSNNYRNYSNAPK